MTARRFELHRDEDVTGVSGTGVVAEGILFSDDVAVLHWVSQWPSTIVHYEKPGMASVEHVHGHGGATRIVWLDDEPRQDCGQLHCHETRPHLHTVIEGTHPNDPSTIGIVYT